MFLNGVVFAFRSMYKNWFYTAVKLLGLGVGIGAALVAALLVRDDLIYDQFFSHPETLFRISSIQQEKGLGPRHDVFTPGDLPKLLNTEYSAELKAAQLTHERFEIRYKGVEAIEGGYSTDRNIFEVLDLKFRAGDPIHALDQPDTAVLTVSKAEKIFGTADALGLQFISLGSGSPEVVRVTGVLEDLPYNTHLDADILVSGTSPFVKHDDTSPRNEINAYLRTYVRLNVGVPRERLDGALRNLVANHYPPDRFGGLDLSFSADPITAVHLDPYGLSDRHGSSIETVTGLGAVGILLLIVAIINYSNLVTAQRSGKVVEIGVRKSVGAMRHQIAGQIFLESAIFSLLGLIIAFCFVDLGLPHLNAFLDRGIQLDYYHDVALDSCAVMLFILSMLGGGTYPAWVLSAIRPSVALKRGKNRPVTGYPMLRSLVIVQFVISIGMIVATTVIYQQGLFATTSALKFDKEQVLLVRDPFACTDEFKQELLSRRGILGAACSWSAPLGNRSTSDVVLSDGRSLTAARQSVDFGFFDLYHLPIIAGRDFSHDRLASDQAPSESNLPMAASVIINETAARYFGFTPGEAVGQAISVRRVSEDGAIKRGKSEIIGVVADFPVESVRSAILPTVFYVDPVWFQLLSVKLAHDDIAAGVASVDTVWHTLYPDRLIQHSFLDARIRDRYETLRQEQTVFLTLSILGILVACIGLFGLAGYVAQTRTKEIGVRKALGATTQQLVRLLVWQFVRPVVIANLIAWPITGWLLERWLDGFALRIDLDPLIFLAAGGFAVAIAVLVTAGHAINVARARPVAALRYE
jgi:putative ABC transport system permease protein